MLHIVSAGPQGAGSEDVPFVVLLHGAGVSSWMWASITDRLPDFATGAVDLPGHGDSRAIAWQSLEKAAAEVARVIDQEGSGQPVHLVGLSLGAVVGLFAIAVVIKRSRANRERRRSRHRGRRRSRRRLAHS